ncbi:DNA topoisomerase I, mitochondrial isoform X3 [Equus asinus]|uniref:DNA topoisomerase I n=2 Tax=Equus TaxID=9789 RepID=A0A8C4LUK9_EQUAS
MGDDEVSDLKQFSVKDKVALTRKRENTEQMKLENSKKRKVKEPNQTSRGRCGEDQQCLKEESTFSISKENPGQGSVTIRSAQTTKPVKTNNHEKPSKKKSQVPRPRGGPEDRMELALGGCEMVSGDGPLQAVLGRKEGIKALPRSTLGEGDSEQGDANREGSPVKMKSKQKKTKEKTWEEKRLKGLEEKRAGRCSKASRLEKDHRDASRRKGGPEGTGGRPAARGKGEQSGDKETGAGSPKEGTQAEDRELVTAGKATAEGLLGRRQTDEEGEDTGASRAMEGAREGLGGDTQAGGEAHGHKSKSQVERPRIDRRRKMETAGGVGARGAKDQRRGDQGPQRAKLMEEGSMKRAHGCGPAGEEGAGQEVVPATAPGLGGFPRKTREEKKLKEKKKQGGMKQGRGKELPQEQEQLVGVGTCRGREKKRDAEAPKGQEKEEAGQWRWWEEEKSQDGVKWKQLEHKGPYFAPSYEPLPDGVHFYYDGKPVKLSLAAEEVATFYGKMLDHEYTTKEVFQNNFFSDWRKEMTAEERKIIKHLDKCDFTEIHRYFVDKTAARKALSREEKQKLKEEAEKLQQEFGYCTLDGHREKIGNFKTEPPGLFRGRGDHPKMGMLKRRILPEDVTINCSRDSKIPEPPAGHQWKEVRSDNTVTWLASWTENIQNSIKYVMLNPSSKLKGEKDWQKYEVARRLKGVVDEIRSQYRADWKSREMKKRQCAVALYFIDKLALRAGNEKEEGETADTVGCCSLRVEHIQLYPEADGCQHVVELDFLGKDSIRYYNRVPVERPVYKNLQLFMENKSRGDDLFDRLTTTSLNKHLQDLMDGLTAKVFRTYNASVTLQEQLRALTRAEDSVAAKILSYNRANRAVAILCNHQRATPKTFEKSMQNLQLKIEAKKKQVAEAKAELKQARAGHKSRGDDRSRSFLEKRERLLEKLEEQLMRLSTQATDKEESKQVALGTSKLNYLDPRISVAWCKRFGVPVERIYNKTQRERFAWALDMAGEDFEF